MRASSRTARYFWLMLAAALVWGQTLPLWGQTVAPPPREQTAAELFRQGRDAIDDQNWTSAQGLLGDYIRRYPKEARVDSALYYQAFALKKLGRLKEAAALLQQLQDAYPQSGWREDAQAMRAELRADLEAPNAAELALQSNDDRIRAAAIQTLFRNDPAKGKLECAKILNQDAGIRIPALCLHLMVQLHDSDSLAKVKEVAGSDKQLMVRAAAVTLLAQLPDADSDRTVKDILFHDRSRVAEAALYAIRAQQRPADAQLLYDVLARAEGVWTRGAAMLLLGAERSESGLNAVMRVQETSTDPLLKKFELDALWRNNSTKAREVLDNAAGDRRRPDVQAAARFYLSPPRSAAAADALARWYDSEEMEDVKLTVLFLLSSTGTVESTNKLRKVESEDGSARMRSQAMALLEGGDVKIPLPLGQALLPGQRRVDNVPREFLDQPNDQDGNGLPGGT
jgi:Tetratricopeptide repeat